MREHILTDRLILRDITEADVQWLFDLDSDPEVMRYIGPRPALDLEGYLARVRTIYLPLQAHAWQGVRIVLDAASGEFHGWVFVRPAPTSKLAEGLGWTRNSEVELGYMYRRSSWGRGIATEAARPLVQIALADPVTTAVVACAMASNAESLRVLGKVGLKRVGEVSLTGEGEPTVKLARSR